MDALAEHGCAFLHHYTPSAPCGPARASLLTGLYPRKHKVTTNRSRFNTDVVNVARACLQAGIRPYLIGYTDTVLDSEGQRPRTVMPGFSVHTYFNLDQEGLGEWVAMLERSGYGPFPDRLKAFQPIEPGSHTSRYNAAQSDTAFIADRTIECIRQHAREPWLIHTTFLRPHPPWVAPRPYDRLYAPEQMEAPLPRPEDPAHPFLRYLDCQSTHPRDAIGEIRAVYSGLVGELDFHFGRIMTALREAGLEDQTLVVFTSDHGEMLGDHGLFGSAGFYDQGYHIPLIVRDPTAPLKGIRADVLTESVDVVPTVLDWLKLAPSEETDGYSLLPLLHQSKSPGRRAGVFWECHFRLEAGAPGVASEQGRLTVWRTRYEKYVHFDNLVPMFFHLAADPHEVVDRAADPAYHGRVQELQQQLLDHDTRHSPAASL